VTTSTTHKAAGYTIDDSLIALVNDKLLPQTTVAAESFWKAFADVVEGVDVSSSSINAVTGSATSLADAGQTLRALNSRWGSLYSALYNEQAIPHSPGLRIGDRYNAARGNRVAGMAKEFLDASFPLNEGSHKDAVSYLVYYHNLMVILADGSTTGLKNPGQFTGKNGPKSEPDSILLRHHDLYVEIQFDRNGPIGKHDLAHIDDIQIEANPSALLHLQADSNTTKLAALASLSALATGRLQTATERNGETRLRKLNPATPYTTRGGDETNVTGCSAAQIRLGEMPTSLVINARGQALPEWVIEATVLMLALQGQRRSCSPQMALFTVNRKLADSCEAMLHQLAAMLNISPPVVTGSNSTGKPCGATVSGQSAATPPQPANDDLTPGQSRTGQLSQRTGAANQAVLSALTLHGFAQ